MCPDTSIPTDVHGKPALHDTNVYRAFVKWTNDESLEQAFIASVAHLAAAAELQHAGQTLCPCRVGRTVSCCKRCTSGWS